MPPASLTAVARHLAFIRETLGPNRGYWVQFLQRWAGGVAGDSWCADFVSLVLEIAYLGQVPLPRSGSTRVLLREAQIRGWVLPQGAAPQVDDLYFFVYVGGDPALTGQPHHMGVVTSTDPLSGIAGNTSVNGKSSDGTGVFEHPIYAGDALVLVRLPK